MNKIRPLKIVCTGAGKHPRVLLMKVVFIPQADGLRDPGVRLRGDALAEYNAGTGPYAGVPLRVRVLKDRLAREESSSDGFIHSIPQRTPSKGWNGEIQRSDGTTTTAVRCSRCRREAWLSEAALRRLGESHSDNSDISQEPL